MVNIWKMIKLRLIIQKNKTHIYPKYKKKLLKSLAIYVIMELHKKLIEIVDVAVVNLIEAENTVLKGNNIK